MYRTVRFPLPFLTALIICLIVAGTSRLVAQGIGIQNGFPFVADPLDTAAAEFLPSAFDGPAGSHGFVVGNADGDFEFTDGTPVRFVGVIVSGSACFPDSSSAIAEARRLRKLGVNLVRFRYMDFSYDWAAALSILDPATGFRSIQADQARRFDWFVHQLKQNGIYTGLTLLSARVPRAEDGLSPEQLDSMPWIGQGVHFLYPEARGAHKTVAAALLEHVNPFTGVAYKDEPAIASLEILHRQAMQTFHRLNYDLPGVLYSWNMSRRLDTLYNAWLRNRYGSAGALANAWSVTPPAGGFPNIVREGSFEGAFESEWTLVSNSGVSTTPILSQSNVPDGDYALQIRIRNTVADLYTAAMWQVVSLEFNKIYQLTFKARSSNPEGRTLGVAIYAADGGLFPGLSQTVEISPEWKEDTLTFLVPVSNTVPQYLYFWYGDKDGELTIDDVRLREIAPIGLVEGESLENVTVGRNPWGQNPILSPRRFIDQAEFYAWLDRDYFSDLRRFIRDSVGARQMIFGAEHLWASTILDAAVAKEFDLSMSAQGWDWISAANETWQIRNWSPLRTGWAGATYNYAATANRGKPFIASFLTPFPNRYQAESMLQVPAYAMLQDWDGFVWEHYDDDVADNRRDYVDSADWYGLRNNPIASALMPSVSQIVRNGLISPARTTIRLQHTPEQLHLYQRLEGAWGVYGVPGAMNGFGPALSRIVLDSVNATDFTQANDYAFEGQVQGEATSDTRELRWEYARSLLTIDAPSVQGVTGMLNRPGGLSLSKLEVNAFTLNETATLLWVPLDPTRELDEPGSRSLLTLVTRSEPTGFVWADTSTASRWGSGPMLMEPARVQLEFKVGSDVSNVEIQPLDQTGMPTGARLAVTKAGNDFRATINQSETPAVWYSVRMIPLGMSADDVATTGDAASLRALPNVVADRGTVFLRLPAPQRDVRIDLYDALGRPVRSIHHGPAEAGERRIDFETGDLATGTYFVKARVGSNGTMVEEIRVAR